MIAIGVRFILFYYIKTFYFYLKKNDTVLEKNGPITRLATKLGKFLYVNYLVAKEKLIMYYFLYLICAVLGSFLHPFFFAFHALELLNKYEELRNFMRAITSPWKQLMLTFVLFLIIQYVFTLVAFLYFSKYFGENGEMCQSLWICFLTIYDMTKKVFYGR